VLPAPIRILLLGFLVCIVVKKILVVVVVLAAAWWKESGLRGLGGAEAEAHVVRGMRTWK
jgi:hypothetical protein